MRRRVGHDPALAWTAFFCRSATYPFRRADACRAGRCAAVLGIEACDVIDAAWIDNGPGWLGIRMASAEKVLGITPARSWTHHIDIGVVGPHAKGGETAFEVRAFFSDHLGAIVEDPVTGSLNASLAQWLFATGVVGEDYVAAQGTRLGRHGRIYLTRDDAGQIWVGGETRTHVEGRLLGL